MRKLNTLRNLFGRKKPEQLVPEGDRPLANAIKLCLAYARDNMKGFGPKNMLHLASAVAGNASRFPRRSNAKLQAAIRLVVDRGTEEKRHATKVIVDNASWRQNRRDGLVTGKTDDAFAPDLASKKRARNRRKRGKFWHAPRASAAAVAQKGVAK